MNEVYPRPSARGVLGRRGNWRASVWMASLVAVLLAAGCVQQKVQTPGGSSKSIAQKQAELDSFLNDCANRLQGISEDLLLYYVNQGRHWPGSLNELQSVASQPLNLNCPDTKQPYAYNPVGLIRPGDPRKLIAYDSVPFNGSRWGIVVDTDPHTGNPQLFVISIPEETFRTYRPYVPKQPMMMPGRPSQPPIVNH